MQSRKTFVLAVSHYEILRLLIYNIFVLCDFLSPVVHSRGFSVTVCTYWN